MKILLFLILIIGTFIFIPSMTGIAFGAVTASSNFCKAFPTHPECTGWRVEPISDNFWFCEYVHLPSMCNNPPDLQKQIISRTDINYCCNVIGSHTPKNLTLDDVRFADMSKQGQLLDITTSKELVIWTEKDHYTFGERVNIYGKFNFDDPVLKNNNPFVDVSFNDRKVVLDLPVHSNGWFAGYFVLSNPYMFYTGNNLVSVEYFHTPTQHEPDKFTTAYYRVTTGEITTTEPFSIAVKLLPSSKNISYEIITESGNPANLDFALTRLVTPKGLVFSLPSVSSMPNVLNYLDFSLESGSYEIVTTLGNFNASTVFEYTQ